MNTLQITPSEERRLAKLRADFIAQLERLPEKRRIGVIKAAAHNVLGTTDPWTQAVARQMLDVHNINEGILATQAEIAEIDGTDLSGFRPRDRDFRGRMLARRADLEESIKGEMVRALTVAQSDLAAEREKAIEHFRAADERATKAQTILDTADRLRAEAAARDAETKARAIVNAERVSAGKKPLPSEDE